MTRYNILFTIIPLLFVLYWLSSLITIHGKEVESFNTWLLAKQVNNASDAAVEEMRMYSENMDIDYLTASIEIDPTAAVREFESMMCDNLQLPVTQETMDYVANNYIKILLLCTNDGFYPYMNVGVTEDKKAFISYPMIPYTGRFLNYDPADVGIIDESQEYAFTLAKDKLYKCEYITTSDSGKVALNMVTTVKNGDDVYSPSDSVKQQISERITENVEYFLRSAIYSTYSNEDASTVIIPSGLDTINGGQGINGPTALAIVDTSGHNMDIYKAAFGVGGSVINKNDPILAWQWAADDPNPSHKIPGTDKPKKVWAYSSDLKKTGWIAADGTYVAAYAEALKNAIVFQTPFAAAEHGYDQCWEVSEFVHEP